MYKKIIALLALSLVIVLPQKYVCADFNAATFAQNFNNFRPGYTPNFIAQGSGPQLQVIDVSANGFNLNLGSYSPNLAGYVDPLRANMSPNDIGTFTSLLNQTSYFYADDLYFSSFSLTSTPASRQEFIGKLNYDSGATRTSSGQAINLGIVYLYQKYATGTLYGYDYAANSTAAELQVAMQLLLSGSITTEQWETNSFLSHLVTELGGSGVWLTQYDLNETYPAWLDNNYAVYVMNLTTMNGSAGDVLYMVRRDSAGGNGVPEPTTLFLWTGIGLGLAGITRHRAKRPEPV